MKLLKIIAIFTFSVYASTEDDCPTSGYPFERHLATKTPYRLVANKSLEPIKFEGCEPAKTWMIVRHGTRNPKQAIIDGMKDRLPEIRDIILESSSVPNANVRNVDLDLFRKWKAPKLDSGDVKKLAHEGEDEMLLLAERMQSRLPNIFGSIYSNSSYRFKFTHSQRTKKSALYFAAGLFGRQTVRDVYFPEPSKTDIILRFYKICKKWTEEIKKKQKIRSESISFEKSTEMNNIVNDINDRLGLDDENHLSLADILLIYSSCAFETAWNKNKRSPWCSLFTEDDLKVLEYQEDLDHYWRDGYGHELTYKQACPTFGDMMNFLGSDDPLPKATVYFSHSGTILKLLAHLGLYQDEEHITSKNFEKQQDRKWKTSKIDAFGSNLIFTLFRCDDGTNKILTMHQEHVVRLPSCPDEDLCDVKKIESYYIESLESCDFNLICENNN